MVSRRCQLAHGYGPLVSLAGSLIETPRNWMAVNDAVNAVIRA